MELLSNVQSANEAIIMVHWAFINYFVPVEMLRISVISTLVTQF